MNTLQCEIRSLGGDEFKKTAEITGDRTSHLSSLSANLAQMQSEVNLFLTQLVEKEKAEKKSSTPKGESSVAATSGDEGVCNNHAATIIRCILILHSLILCIDMEEGDGDDGHTARKEPAAKKPKTL